MCSIFARHAVTVVVVMGGWFTDTSGLAQSTILGLLLAMSGSMAYVSRVMFE